jgi:hypothetical protein
MFLRWLKRCRRRIRNRIDAQPAGIKPEPTIRLTGGYRHLGPDKRDLSPEVDHALTWACIIFGCGLTGVIVFNLWRGL